MLRGGRAAAPLAIGGVFVNQGRAGEIVLTVLAVLVAIAPLLWLAGVPLGKVAAALAFWSSLFLLVAWLGGRYGSEG